MPMAMVTTWRRASYSPRFHLISEPARRSSSHDVRQLWSARRCSGLWADRRPIPPQPHARDPEPIECFDVGLIPLAEIDGIPKACPPPEPCEDESAQGVDLGGAEMGTQ